ncbi:Lrp/AsnC family transcriptional regulator [Microbacterium sp. A93]
MTQSERDSDETGTCLVKAITLDDADHQLIGLLTENGRISNRELGSQVGLTEVTIAARLRRLRESGVFRVGAVVDWAAAGYTYGLTFWITVEGRDPVKVADEIAEAETVHVVGVTLGTVDIIVYALGSGYADIHDLTRRFQRVPGVDRVVVDVQYEALKYSHRYALLRQDSHEISLPNPAYDLDDLDREIMQVLLRDGQMSNRMLARQIGSSEGTVRARLRRLEESGLLRIRGQVDPVLAQELRSLAIVSIVLEGTQDDEVVAQLVAMPSVLGCVRTSGTGQLLVNLGTSSRSALVDSIQKEIRRIPGIRSTQTWEIVRFVKMLSHFARFI